LPAPGALHSRVFLRIPIGSVDVGTACCARHRHALRTRISAPQARAHCLLACLASSCSAISATAVQPSSAVHCGIGRRETRVQARRLRTPVHNTCSIVVIGLACLASSYSAISATAVQPSSAAHCGIRRRETLRASTQIAYTRAQYMLDCCHWPCLSCVVMLCHQRHCRAALQCRPLWDRA